MPPKIQPKTCKPLIEKLHTDLQHVSKLNPKACIHLDRLATNSLLAGRGPVARAKPSDICHTSEV